jgi:hypothetical protein
MDDTMRIVDSLELVSVIKCVIVVHKNFFGWFI